MYVSVSREEMETVIRLGWGEEFCTVVTSDPKHYRDMVGKGLEPSKVCCNDKEPVSWEFKAPAEWFRMPQRPKQLNMSDEAKAAAAERMRSARKK